MSRLAGGLPRTVQRVALVLLALLPAQASLTKLASDMSVCHALDDVGDEAATACYREILNVAITATEQAEAHWRLGNINAANRAFRRATEEHRDDPDLRARWGHLFLDAHQDADADALFKEALAINPDHINALLGQAQLFADRFESRAERVIDQILILSPGNTRARLLRARLLLETKRTVSARDILLDVVATEPAPQPLLEAYALLAAADHIEGTATALVGADETKLPSPWVAKALAINRHYGDIHAVPAHFYVITRRYQEAVALLEQAVAVEPNNWRAHTDLGTNLLRVNRLDDARRHLKTAYSGDSFNAETVNTLRLLDSLDEFDTYESESLILRIHPDESAVLTPYVRELVTKTVAEMAGRYGFTLQRPVVLELYQRHDDFAVRTAGLPGIGILGASFGDVVVMDGPSAKSAADFDWYSAVWHELAHVVTLNATNNLVSRWFSEGVSVYEEQRFGPSPNGSVPLNFLAAMAENRLLPSATLDKGFMRQDYENQIGVSYVQSGLLCTYIADNYEGGLTRMLQAYRDGADTLAAIEQALGVTSTELDEGFFAHLESQFGEAAENLDTLTRHTQAARTALNEQRWADAALAAQQAIDLFPSYVGPSSPYLILAKATERTTVSTKAPQALGEYFRRGGREPGSLQHLARLLHRQEKPMDAIEVQQVLARLDPLKTEHHATLGAWLTEYNLHDKALTEYQAVLALEPHDKATAHYQIASALHHLDRTEEARRELLYALEIAPRFSPALSLLMEINR